MLISFCNFLVENIDINDEKYKGKIKFCYYVDTKFVYSCMPEEHNNALAEIKKKYPGKKITIVVRWLNNKRVNVTISDKKNKNNLSAKINDEYYTRYSDIEKEITKISDQLKDKIVYCNCDDPKESKFWEYLKNNFSNLKLKKIVATYYTEGRKKSTAVTYDGNKEEQYEIEGNGDFRSESCVNILKRCDVVITNPPFSLTKEFIPLLVQSQKKFIFLERQSKLANKSVFKAFQNGDAKIDFIGSMRFKRPNGSIDRLSDMCWITNMDNVAHPRELNLTKSYDENNYQKYDNYDAINVSKIENIPKDYNGLIGVPTTIFSKYNPDKIELVSVLNKPSLNGDKLFKRVIIRLKNN